MSIKIDPLLLHRQIHLLTEVFIFLQRALIAALLRDDLSLRSAALIQQQYNRFLSAPAGQADQQAESLAKQIFSIADPSEEEVRDLFD